MVMNPREEIDKLIAQNQDWRGATLAKLRKTILEVDPEIVEEWKWMGSPVWELQGIICGLQSGKEEEVGLWIGKIRADLQ